MLTTVKDFLTPYAAFFHQDIPTYRQNRYIQIVLLRETKSHAIFTTEGAKLDVERLQAGLENTHQIDRVVMYKRKQIAPERRTGKSLLRDLNILTSPVTIKQPAKTGKKATEKTKQRDTCQIMGNSCGACPDCILYGYAATSDAGSQKARILTDSGFVVRTLMQVMRDIKLNAIRETTKGGIAGSAFASRENLLPQLFLPTAETLVDVTMHEFLYVLGNILRTTRYGAESNREGFVRNHLLGIYFSDTELFSNLEMTQCYYDLLSHNQDEKIVPDYLDINQFKTLWPQVEQRLLQQVYGRKKKLDQSSFFLEALRALYEDEQALRELLQALDQDTIRYLAQIKEEA